MLGISTLTTFGINAALFGMVAHGLITGMLFFLAGSVKHRYHTLEIKRLSGMLIQAPRLAWILGFAAMASLGLPGLAGFWGEFPAILSAYNPGFGLSTALFRTLMVIAAIGTVLADWASAITHMEKVFAGGDLVTGASNVSSTMATGKRAEMAQPMADAAADYCLEQGYEHEVKEQADGTRCGVCTFSDGRSCKAWAYYQGMCE